jgi:hypothetical protein
LQFVVKQYEPELEIEYVDVLAVVPAPTVWNIGEPVPDDVVFNNFSFYFRVYSSLQKNIKIKLHNKP